MWHRCVDAVRALFGGEKAYQKAYERAIAANRAIARHNELASRVEFKTLEEKLHSLLDELLKTQKLSFSQAATALPGRVGRFAVLRLGRTGLRYSTGFRGFEALHAYSAKSHHR